MRRKVVTTSSFVTGQQPPPQRHHRYEHHHRHPNTMSISPVVDTTNDNNDDRMDVDQIGDTHGICLYANEAMPSCPPLTPAAAASTAGVGGSMGTNLRTPSSLFSATHTPCHIMGGLGDIPAQQVCEFHIGHLQLPVHINTSQCFQAHGITVYHLIGEGNNGAAYYACFYKNCECVVKLGNINEDEFIIAREMGAIGVGPQVVYRSACPVMIPVNMIPGGSNTSAVSAVPTTTTTTFSQQQQPPFFQPAYELAHTGGYNYPHEQQRIGVDFVVMQRLDMTLLQWLRQGNVLLPVHAMRIHQLFSKAYNAGLIHMDIKSDNIMVRLYHDGNDRNSTYSGSVSSDIEQFYMIDFGWSYYLPMHPYDGYDPQAYNGWTLATPAHSQTHIAAAWDQLCLFADLQMSSIISQNPNNMEFMRTFANLLQLYYSIPPYAFSNMFSYLTHTLPAEGEAVLINP